MTTMLVMQKKYFGLGVLLVLFFMTSCGIDRQAKELRALEKCKYELVSADSVFLAGTDVRQLIESRRVDVSRLPGVALGFLSGNVPLSAILNVQVTNPTNTLAGIGQFSYIIEVEGHQIIDGTSDLPVRVPAGETVVVPVKLQGNMYALLSNQEVLQRVVGYMQTLQSGASAGPVNMAIKIKPTLALGNTAIDYPGFITINRRVDPAALLQ